MRKISANYIFPISSKPLRNGIIILNDNNEIADIVENSENKEFSNVEFYNGIIVPGFVNTHCHLELSQKNPIIEEGSGLVNFLYKVSKSKEKNNLDADFCKEMDKTMYTNGIQLVGDISNTELTAEIKLKSNIVYHTFVELIGLNNTFSDEIFDRNKLIYDKFHENKSITPHTLYTVDKIFLEKINQFAKKNNSIISIHNQETKSENMMFENAEGELFDFIQSFENTIKNYLPTKKTSLKSFLPYFSKHLNIILIHNTYSSKVDIDFAENYSKNIFWCLCPNSNLIIENSLPNINLFRSKNLKLTLGTDSLMSNNELNILSEIKIIQKYFPEIPLSEILEWATLNGAIALKQNEIFGSLEKGKSPGINLISNIDFDNFKLTEKSKVKRIA